MASTTLGFIPEFSSNRWANSCPGNTLGVKPAKLILPWARSNQPGYLLSGNKFDLDQWNPAYFERLKDFITQAAKRGIVVEVCLFNSQYGDTWPLSPLYYENNIQGVGHEGYKDAQTLKDPVLVERQAAYVRKIVQEVNGFDNVILEVCDEPSLFTPVEEAGPWVAHMLEVTHDAEENLPKKHSDRPGSAGARRWPDRFLRQPIELNRSYAIPMAHRAIGRWEDSKASIVNTVITSRSSKTRPTITPCIRETRSQIQE